jgi:peptide/nickel transport system permease protein
MVAAAFALLALIVLAGVLADVLAPHSPLSIDLRSRFRPPAFMGGEADHLLGTDELGRDLFSRLLHAARLSIAVAAAGTVISALLGTGLGLLAAWRRGVVDEVVMMLVDAQASMPFIVVALAVLAFVGGSPLLFVLLLGLNKWETFARLVRGAVLSAMENGYARAAWSLGAGPLRLYLRHVLPNVAGVLIVQFTLTFPDTILLETSLSFLGFGIQPPLTSLGQMLGAGRSHLLHAPWIAVSPGVVIFLAALSMSLVGDWLRDRIDPTTRRRGPPAAHRRM